MNFSKFIWMALRRTNVSSFEYKFTVHQMYGSWHVRPNSSQKQYSQFAENRSSLHILHSTTKKCGTRYRVQLKNTLAKFYRDWFRYGFHQMYNMSSNYMDFSRSIRFFQLLKLGSHIFIDRIHIFIPYNKFD